MVALFKRKSKAAPLANTPISSSPSDNNAVRIIGSNPQALLVRHVKIGDTIYAVHPDERLTGILASGEPYYPYDDDDLPTIDLTDINDTCKHGPLGTCPKCIACYERIRGH